MGKVLSLALMGLLAVACGMEPPAPAGEGAALAPAGAATASQATRAPERRPVAEALQCGDMLCRLGEICCSPPCLGGDQVCLTRAECGSFCSGVVSHDRQPIAEVSRPLCGSETCGPDEICCSKPCLSAPFCALRSDCNEIIC